MWKRLMLLRIGILAMSWTAQESVPPQPPMSSALLLRKHIAKWGWVRVQESKIHTCRIGQSVPRVEFAAQHEDVSVWCPQQLHVV